MRIKILALLGLSLVACRGGGGGNTGDDVDAPPGGPDTPSGMVRIQDVQNDAMPPGTPVKLKGVVVTAIDAFGSRTGDLFVQDPAGGPFSGVKVFGAPLDQVAGLQVGDLVDIDGAQKDEFALPGDMTGRKVTELKPSGTMTITKKGTGAVPAPAMVDAVAISAMDKASREAEWEKWEGVLITVINARQIAPSRAFGMNPDQVEFRITGVARVQSVLTDLPVGNAFGVCYAKITGVGDYFFNDLILPRSADDVAMGGAGCKPMATTIVSAQSVVNTEVVNLTNVIVTARDDIGTNSKGFWVADALVGAPNNGILVFTRDVAVPANYVPGAVVTVQGAIEEFDLGSGGQPPTGDTLTEVVDPVHAFVSAGTGAPTPITRTAEELSDIGATGEPFEGVLVRVVTMKVTNAALGNGKVELSDNANKKLVMDDDLFMTGSFPAQTNGTCLNVVGVMSVQVTDNIRTLLPRTSADITIGTGCN